MTNKASFKLARSFDFMQVPIHEKSQWWRGEVARLGENDAITMQ